jgi:alpha/beta superfamily hydrolase
VTPTTIESSGGVTLELVVKKPPNSIGSVVICHPHPDHGGTMRHPLIAAIAAESVTRGFTSVRFNFRGVGKSTGASTLGIDEINDLSAVVEHAEAEAPPVIGVAGWSFGAAIALAWQAQSQSTIPYVGIAPPVQRLTDFGLSDGASLMPAPRTFIIGTRDQFVDADDLSKYAESIDASVTRYENTDHFFVNKYQRLAHDVLEAMIG